MPESNWIMQLLYSRLMRKFIYNQYEIASVKRSVTDKQLLIQSYVLSYKSGIRYSLKYKLFSEEL